jgi:hypothetical protein
VIIRAIIEDNGIKVEMHDTTCFLKFDVSPRIALATKSELYHWGIVEAARGDMLSWANINENIPETIIRNGSQIYESETSINRYVRYGRKEILHCDVCANWDLVCKVGHHPEGNMLSPPGCPDRVAEVHKEMTVIFRDGAMRYGFYDESPGATPHIHVETCTAEVDLGALSSKVQKECLSVIKAKRHFFWAEWILRFVTYNLK